MIAFTDAVLCPRCGTNERRRTQAPHRCLFCAYVCCADWSQDRVQVTRRAIRDAAKLEAPAAPRVTAMVAVYKRRLFYP